MCHECLQTSPTVICGGEREGPGRRAKTTYVGDVKQVVHVASGCQVSMGCAGQTDTPERERCVGRSGCEHGGVAPALSACALDRYRDWHVETRYCVAVLSIQPCPRPTHPSAV